MFKLTLFVRAPTTYVLMIPGSVANVLEMPKTIPAYAGAMSFATNMNPPPKENALEQYKVILTEKIMQM